MVRRSWLTPASIAVRCSIERSTRAFISRNACAALPHFPRAARDGSSAPRGPLPKLSAASASRRIGLIWLRRNNTATIKRIEEVPSIQKMKISELEA